MNCTAKIVNRLLNALAYSSFGFLAQLDQSIDFTVYPIPLDPGNLPALDLWVVKWQVATPSHVRPLRAPGKVDTPKPRLLRRAHACPDEMKFGGTSGRSNQEDQEEEKEEEEEEESESERIRTAGASFSASGKKFGSSSGDGGGAEKLVGVWSRRGKIFRT
ncbi:hypothetical protein CRG98_031737 [Punica granatum]|uniref:Uncharacterized protein n=1 Tax=Punica granatum TaxID=22663 RepID=A0A2I0IVS7_PUNGR|nr:hypothetical protein CRG98_031737 [Punica granatum]